MIVQELKTGFELLKDIVDAPPLLIAVVLILVLLYGLFKMSKLYISLSRDIGHARMVVMNLVTRQYPQMKVEEANGLVLRLLRRKPAPWERSIYNRHKQHYPSEFSDTNDIEMGYEDEHF